jgi:hypothetical protein
MDILTQPKWQYSLRDAQKTLGQSRWAEETVDQQVERMQGNKLHATLRNFFGIPVPKGTIQRNYYTADGIWFRLKFAANDVAADGNPLHDSTNAVSGHHKSQAKATTTFTLYVGHVTPDESYPHWPQPKALVAHELGLFYTNYMPIQAELGNLIDAVEAEYQAALPGYLAWYEMQLLPGEAEQQADYLRQLVRQALRRMRVSEVLAAVEPVGIKAADEADAITELDGMTVPAPAEPLISFADLEAQADTIISKIDQLLAEHGIDPDEFDGFDAFDPNNTPDDMDDDDSDDDDEPDVSEDTPSDIDDEPAPINIDAPGYEVERIAHDTEINEADLKGFEYPYPVS